MKFLKRISRLVTANLNHLLDQAENPEVMIKQIIRDMEANIIALRRETVRAVARQKHLEKEALAVAHQIELCSTKAQAALQEGNEVVARELLQQKVQAEQRQAGLTRAVKAAQADSARLKEDLLKLEDQVQEARRKKEELIRRQRAAAMQKRTRSNLRSPLDAFSAAGTFASGDDPAKDLEAYEAAIQQLEVEAEAAEEVEKLNKSDETETEEQELRQRVEAELARLKKQTRK